MENSDISKYIQIARNRIYWFIIPFLAVLLGGLYYILVAPRIYQAKTLILVQGQTVPQDYVKPLVSNNIDDRLRTITQQVTSRTNLESIIREYRLYNSPDDSNMFMEDKVKKMRKSIKVDVDSTTASSRRFGPDNTFTITFQNEDPKKAMEVTNTLASNFITENLRVRESQAVGTASFLNEQLQDNRRKLAAIEESVKKYRLKYMGQLPDQLQANIAVLNRLQMQLQQLNTNLNDLENRKLQIQQQIDGSNNITRQSLNSSSVQDNSDYSDLPALKARLLSLKSRYTDKYPDVIHLEERIAKLEKEQAVKIPEKGKQVDNKTNSKNDMLNNTNNLMSTQLEQANNDITNTQKEIKETGTQIAHYQQIIDDTPKREQELTSIERNYGNLKKMYDSLLERKLEAGIAVSMEKQQKGEQFNIIDPAQIPDRPVKPNVRKIALAVIALALGMGCGFVFLIEFLDTSYKTPEEVEEDTGIPVLTSISVLYTEIELKIKKRRHIIAGVSIALIFILSAGAIVFSVKGLGLIKSLTKIIAG